MPSALTVLDRLRRDLVLAGGRWPDGFDRRAGELLGELLRANRSLDARIRQLIQLHDGALRMSHERIAEMIGSHRETVTRALRKMPDVQRERARGCKGGKWLYTLLLLTLALPALAQVEVPCEAPPDVACTTSDWIVNVRWCPADGPVAGYVVLGTDETGFIRARHVENVTEAAYDQTGMTGDVTFTVQAKDVNGALGPLSDPSPPNLALAAGGDFDRNGSIIATDFMRWVSAFTRGCEPRVGP
jgi:hypothetical protein